MAYFGLRPTKRGSRWDGEMIENMVARDGIEPPPPAFSDLVQLEPTTTYRSAGDCQPHKHVQATAIMGWDHGLS